MSGQPHPLVLDAILARIHGGGRVTTEGTFVKADDNKLTLKGKDDKEYVTKIEAFTK
jgi:hypothetical protein